MVLTIKQQFLPQIILTLMQNKKTKAQIFYFIFYTAVMTIKFAEISLGPLWFFFFNIVKLF